MDNFTERLQQAGAHDDRAERTLHVAAVLCEALTAAGALPVLVGGGAVEVYTRSAYTTHDLDFVAATTSSLAEAMAELGFLREGRHWIHAALSIVVEFPGTVLEPAEAISIDVDGDILRIIAIEDLVVDRMASWKHWGWVPDGAAAVLLIAIHDRLDAGRLARRATQEDVADALDALRSLASEGASVTDARLRELRAGLERRQEHAP